MPTRVYSDGVKLTSLLVTAFSIIALNAGTASADTTGLVVSVHDGDTLTVLVGKQQVKVRLAEIDAPELRQSFGNRSKQSLAELRLGRIAERCFGQLQFVMPLAIAYSRSRPLPVRRATRARTVGSTAERANG